MSRQANFSLNAADQLEMLAEALNRMAITGLQLQIMAQCQQIGSQAATLDHSPIARAAAEAQTSLLAVARHMLQQSAPRIRAVLAEIQSIAGFAAENGAASVEDLAQRLKESASGLDRARAAVLGFARAKPQGLGIVRISEQRLWGELTSELHRIEGTDGPMMRLSTAIEAATFDLTAALQHLLGSNRFGSSSQRFDLAYQICAQISAGSEDELGDMQDTSSPEAAEIVAQALRLSADYRLLALDLPQIGMALQRAMQASTLLLVSGWLDDALEEIDRLLSRFAREHRGLAGAPLRSRTRQDQASRLSAEQLVWRHITQELGTLIAFSNRAPALLARRDAARARLVA